MREDIQAELEARVAAAQRRYGPFASTHEALGVALEEWDELRDAIRSNSMIDVYSEALDLAACMVKLAENVEGEDFIDRSTK